MLSEEKLKLSEEISERLKTAQEIVKRIYGVGSEPELIHIIFNALGEEQQNQDNNLFYKFIDELELNMTEFKFMKEDTLTLKISKEKYQEIRNKFRITGGVYG